MKIHSNHQGNSINWRIKRRAYRLLSFCSAVALCMMTGSYADAQSRQNNRSPASPTESSSMVRNGLFLNGGESYQVVNTAAFRTAADIGTTESGSIAQVGFRGGCDSCGTACGGSCARSYGSCNNYGNPCAPCEPYCYALVEGLYMELDSDRGQSLSPDFDMNGFDFQWAPRITLGTVPDCVRGYEISFTGPLEWDMSGIATDQGFGLDTLLMPGLPVASSDLSAFSDADLQFQTYTADYWSLEFNRTLIGWEVAKLLAGVRYISYEEEYAYYSQNLNEAGLLFSDVENQMFGIHLGMDLLYPISQNAYTDFRARVGGFINSADSNVILDNAGDRVLRTGGEDEELAGVFELGGGIRYQVGQLLSIRTGFELWYMSGVATATDQFPRNIIRPTTGREIQVDDDIFVTGFSVGAELKY